MATPVKKKAPAKKKTPAKKRTPSKKVTPENLLPESVFVRARESEPADDPFPLHSATWKDFGKVFNPNGRSIAVWWTNTNGIGREFGQRNGTVHALWVTERIEDGSSRDGVVEVLANGGDLAVVVKALRAMGVAVAKTVSIIGVRWYPGKPMMSELRKAFDEQDSE